MKSALERARKRKEEEQKAEAERVAAAKKKADELAKKMEAEEKRKQEEAAAKKAAKKAEMERLRKEREARTKLTPPTAPAAERAHMTPPTGPAALVKGRQVKQQPAAPAGPSTSASASASAPGSVIKPYAAVAAVGSPAAATATAVKAEAKPEDKAEDKSETKPETKSETKPETKVESKTKDKAQATDRLQPPTRAHRSTSNASIGDDSIIKNVKSLIDDDHDDGIKGTTDEAQELEAKLAAGKSASAPTSVVGSSGSSWSDLSSNKKGAGKALWNSAGNGAGSSEMAGGALWGGNRFAPGMYSGSSDSGLFDASRFGHKAGPKATGSGPSHGHGHGHGHGPGSAPGSSPGSGPGPHADAHGPHVFSPQQQQQHHHAQHHHQQHQQHQHHQQTVSPGGPGGPSNSASTSPFAQEGGTTPNGSNRGFSRFFPNVQDAGSADGIDAGSPVRNGYRRGFERGELDGSSDDTGGIPRVVLPPSSVISPPGTSHTARAGTAANNNSRQLPAYLQSGLGSVKPVGSGAGIDNDTSKFGSRFGNGILAPVGGGRSSSRGEDAGFAQIGRERAAAAVAAKTNARQDYTLKLAESAEPATGGVPDETTDDTVSTVDSREPRARQTAIAKLPETWDGDVDTKRPAEPEFEYTPADFGSSAYLLDESGYVHRKEFENPERNRTDYTWVHLPGMDKLGIHTKSRAASKVPRQSQSQSSSSQTRTHHNHHHRSSGRSKK